MKCPCGTWDCWHYTTPNATFWRTDSRSCVRTGVRLSLILTTRITSTSALLSPVRVRWMLKWNNSKFPRMAILFVWSYPISKKASARAWIRETDRQRQGEGVFCTCLCYTHTPTSTLADTVYIECTLHFVIQGNTASTVRILECWWWMSRNKIDTPLPLQKK